MKTPVRRTDLKRPSWSNQEEAVSPIIATILMVAVTVALAATVYILVSYYTPSTAPFVGTMTVVSASGGTAVVQMNLASPGTLSTPSDFHIQVVNSSSIGTGWTIVNATITNPDGTSFYMNSFKTSGSIWTSSGITAGSGAKSIESGAMISLTFNSHSGSIVFDNMKIVVSYSGSSGSISATL